MPDDIKERNRRNGSQPHWSKKEISILKQYYGKTSMKDLCQKLPGRTEKSINSKAGRLKTSKPKKAKEIKAQPIKISPDIQNLKKLIDQNDASLNKLMEQVSEKTGIKIGTVRSHLYGINGMKPEEINAWDSIVGDSWHTQETTDIQKNTTAKTPTKLASVDNINNIMNVFRILNGNLGCIFDAILTDHKPAWAAQLEDKIMSELADLRDRIEKLESHKEGQEAVSIQSENKQTAAYHTRSIYQLDLDNNIVKQFESISDAARAMNMSSANIDHVLAGKQKTAGGYKWVYVDEYGKDKAEPEPETKPDPNWEYKDIEKAKGDGTEYIRILTDTDEDRDRKIKEMMLKASAGYGNNVTAIELKYADTMEKTYGLPITQIRQNANCTLLQAMTENSLFAEILYGMAYKGAFGRTMPSHA